jgi:hypothetical protein
LSGVAASPQYSLSSDTTYASAARQKPFCFVPTMLWTYAVRSGCAAALGIGRYPGSRLNSVGMSVDPWMLACPRIAMMPPPGRPMLPSSSWMIAAVRMHCTPTLCCVHPTA